MYIKKIMNSNVIQQVNFKSPLISLRDKSNESVAVNSQ